MTFQVFTERYKSFLQKWWHLLFSAPTTIFMYKQHHFNNNEERTIGEFTSTFILLLSLLAWEQIWKLVNVISGLVALTWKYSSSSAYRNVSICFLQVLSVWSFLTWFTRSRGTEGSFWTAFAFPLHLFLASLWLFYRVSIFNMLPFFPLFILLPAKGKSSCACGSQSV